MPNFKDFTFPSTTGKNTIHARICIPDTVPRGIVQIAHGITEHIGNYRRFMMFLAENGFIAVGNDHLGHGLSAEYPDGLGFMCEENGWDHAAGDVNRLRLIMKNKYPHLPYSYFGFSMGSFLVRTCLIKYPGCCDTAIICGTGNQKKSIVNFGINVAERMIARKGPRYPGKIISKIVFGPYLARIKNPASSSDWLTRDPEAVRRFNEDPLCGFVPSVSLFRDMFTGILFITDKNNVSRMDKDTHILFVSGGEDPVGDYGKGVIRAYNAFLKAGMKDVSLMLYGGARHGVLSELNKDEVMNNILCYITKYV